MVRLTLLLFLRLSLSAVASDAGFASVILLPPMLRTVSSILPLTWSASISSPPPMLLPLMSTLGTVRRPVDFSS